MRPASHPPRLPLALALCLLGALVLAAGAGALRGPVATGAASPATPYVAVQGDHLVNAAGETVRLLGVDRSGTEYKCVDSDGQEIFDGPSDESAVRAMASWHINAVRVPLNEDCWLGINGLSPNVSGAAYRTAIEQYVSTLQSRGLVAILDLHWAAPGAHIPTTQWPMADAEHAPAFWESVAEVFGSNHGVVFDLFNEPYIGSWSCWLSGCSTTFEGEGAPVTYQTAGMQSLVNAVRSTGAGNVLMLGGLGYAGSDGEWLAHEPSDPDHQLAVSFHTYNFAGCSEACWNSTIAPLAQHVPVITGELGENRCRATYIDQYMSWADARGISYLGWAWDSTRAPSYWSCGEGPALIKNYSGAPTAFGKGLREHLAALARLASRRSAARAR